MKLLLPGGVNLFSTGHADDAADQYVVPDPTDGDLQQALAALARGEVEFVILDDDRGTYLQAAGDGDGPYALEYQSGSVDQHYAAVQPAPRRAQVAEAFLAFARRDASWKALFAWERMQL